MAHIDNSPTFSLQRSRSEKVPLQLLSNQVPGDCRTRACVDSIMPGRPRNCCAPGANCVAALPASETVLYAGQKPLRNVVLAASLTPASEAALGWVVQQLCRKGDAVHLACVVCCLHTHTEVRTSASRLHCTLRNMTTLCAHRSVFVLDGGAITPDQLCDHYA